MRKDDYVDYEELLELLDSDGNSKNDSLSIKMSIIVPLVFAIPTILMYVVTEVLTGNENWWVVAIGALFLCIAIMVLGIIILKVKKLEKAVNIFLHVGLASFVALLMVLIVYIWWHRISLTSNKEIDPAIDMEQSRISDTLIIADMSSHNMHEKDQGADSNEPEPQPVIQVSRSSFMQCLQAASQGEIRGVRYQKYKRGEEQQMFAIVEEATGYEKTDEENLYGTIWYVDKYGAKEMDSEAKEYKWPYLFFIDDSNENVYLAYKKYQTDDTIIYVLGVNETGPYHPAISGQGSDLRINEYDEIEITENGVYYFCLEGSFKEYGGIEINLAELLRIQDAKIRNTASSLLEEECQINTIYYRENGIININFSKEYETGEIRYFNITFRYDGEKAKIVPAETGEEYGEGIYLDALIPSIAAYPSEFPY